MALRFGVGDLGLRVRDSGCVVGGSGCRVHLGPWEDLKIRSSVKIIVTSKTRRHRTLGDTTFRYLRSA